MPAILLRPLERRLSALLLLATLSAGCGQTGPLYLPDEAPGTAGLPSQSEPEAEMAPPAEDRRLREAPASETDKNDDEDEG